MDMHTGSSLAARRTVRQRLRTLLVHPRLPLMVALLAALLGMPSLGVGWVGDDLWHRTVLKGSPRLAELGILPSGSIMELFRFLDGDPRRAHRLMDIGILPWWTDPTVHGAFMRPITGLTHWLDYRLWPDSAALMHLHSVLWLAALAAVVGVLFRRMMGVTAAAGLAALLFAIDDARGMPVGFLANRNALVAGVFGVLALLAHGRWRRGPRGTSRWTSGLPVSASAGSLRPNPWRVLPSAIAGPVLLAASLFSAEAGVGILAYLISYAFFVDTAPWRWRILALVPYAIVVGVWRIVWRTLGYGVSAGMEFYVDPLAEPLRFLQAVVERAPILLWGQWLGGSDVALLLPPVWWWTFWLVALTFLGWLAFRMVPVLRREPTARFWAAGMLLAIPPACATVPSDRMLLYVGIGAFGLLGMFLASGGGERDQGGSVNRRRVDAGAHSPDYRSDTANGSQFPNRTGRVLRKLLIAVHLIIAPVALALRAANPIGPRSLVERVQQIVPEGASVEGRDLILVNPPIAMAVGFVPITRAEAGQPLPRHIRVLGPSFHKLELYRPDKSTLVVRPEGGYLSYPLDQIFRGPRRRLALGERLELTSVSIEVTALTPEGRPAEAVFRFDKPLEDPKWLWVQWKDGAYVSFTPPPIGETHTLLR